MIMVARVPRQRGGGKRRPDCHNVANVVAVSVAAAAFRRRSAVPWPQPHFEARFPFWARLLPM
jgi:hypothetical protein